MNNNVSDPWIDESLVYLQDLLMKSCIFINMFNILHLSVTVCILNVLNAATSRVILFIYLCSCFLQQTCDKASILKQKNSLMNEM